MLVYHRPPEQPFIQSFPSCVADLCKMRVRLASSCQTHSCKISRTITALSIAYFRISREISYLWTAGILSSPPSPSIASIHWSYRSTHSMLPGIFRRKSCMQNVYKWSWSMPYADRHYGLETTVKGIFAALTFLWLHLWLWFFRS